MEGFAYIFLYAYYGFMSDMRSLIHLNLTFVPGIRQRSEFIFCR